jgi:uncharacterized cupredoxin-like copper-binding protein
MSFSRIAMPSYLSWHRSSRNAPGVRLLALVALAAGVTWSTAGCGAASTQPPASTDPMATVPATAAGSMASHSHEAARHSVFTFGEPGDKADSTRTVEINGGDDLKWSPPAIDVALGETVTLRVVNNGTLPHDFLLGDASLQSEHATEMAAAGGTMPDDEHHLMLQPGESKEIYWHFTEPGEVMYGCHTPGHYEAGMVGTVTVR